MGVTVLRPPLCVRLEGCCEFPQKVGRHGKIKTLVARAELNTCMFTPSLQKSILCSYNLSRKPVLALWAGIGKMKMMCTENTEIHRTKYCTLPYLDLLTTDILTSYLK